MQPRYRIANTTRAERGQIVRDALSCGGGGCESCSSCGVYGAGDPVELYRPYVEGLQEIDEITREFHARVLLGRGKAAGSPPGEP